VWRLLRKPKEKKNLMYDLVILLLEIYLEESKSAYNKDMCTPIAALFTIAKLDAHEQMNKNTPNKAYLHYGDLFSREEICRK
jgi:hypothetical protein